MKPVIEKWFLDAGFTVRLYEVHCKNTDKDKEFGAFKKDTEDGTGADEGEAFRGV